MIKVIAIEGKDKQKTVMEYYTHPHGLREAIGALHWYQAKTPNWEGTAYLQIDGVFVCDDQITEFFKKDTPTINSCEAFLLSIADDMISQSKMGGEGVRELNEREVDKGFLVGYFGREKKENSPYYNQGYQSGRRCAQ
jgi:hypothetical protein